jgi:GNAT superfamily N-acetyltransferase
VRIDRATSADMDPIARLLVEQFDEHDIQTSGEVLEQAIAAILQNEGLGLFLVARDGGDVIGLAVLSFAWTLEHGGKSAWLDELYVIPEHRGRGVGRELLDRVMGEARVLGCKAIDLEVEEAHRRVEHLYQREGYRRWVWMWKLPKRLS